MRIKNTLKNSIYGIISYAFLAGLGLLIRRVFLQTLPVEVLGYEGLFGNVFALISLADLGLETVILYRLFPAFAHDDRQEINNIMAVYKYLYQIVGTVVFIIGLILLPFLRFLISEGNYNWGFVYTIYLIQLIITVASYFLAYKRIMFKVSQREYECTKVDTLGSLVFGLLRLSVLWLLKSYYLYLLCNLFSNLLCNYIISRKVDKEFTFFDENRKVTLQDIRNLNIGKDIKNNLTQKICGVIYGGTDSIVITAMLGVANVGLLANYQMINGYVQKIMDRLLNPLQMSIGNYVHSENQENGLRMFRMFDFISFFLAGIITSCFFCGLNPTISFLFGEQYLLSRGFVAAFCANQYINWNHHLLCFYRETFGRYELDKIPIMIAAILNIVISVALSPFLGMAGIMLGTAIGHLGFWFGRVRVVYTVYIHEPVIKYVLRQLLRLCCCVVEILFAAFLCRGLPGTIWGLIIRLCIAGALPCLINSVLFWKTDEMKCTLEYIRKTLQVLQQKKDQLIKAEDER